MGLINNTVTLDYDYDNWKTMFANEKDLLIKIFNNSSFKIEHVGSTAVKGLAAKPIIDILIGINSFKEFDKYSSKLKKYYTVKDNLNHNEILLIKENKSETSFLIHVLPINDDRYKNMIKFRDILNNDEKVLKEYELLKINLAKKYSNNRKQYTKSKDNFIKKILQTKSC